MEKVIGSANILLVEDNPADREITRRVLESEKVRNTLFTVADGEEALDFLLRRNIYVDKNKSPRPDLVLLDLNLPKLDGKSFLRQVREHQDLRRLQIVVLTTSEQEKDIVESYDLGVSGYITKPVNIDQFRSVIRSLENYWFEVVVLPPHQG